MCEEQIDGAFSAECVLRGSRHFTCFECIVQHCRVKVNAMSDETEDRITCAFPHSKLNTRLQTVCRRVCRPPNG